MGAEPTALKRTVTAKRTADVSKDIAQRRADKRPGGSEVGTMGSGNVPFSFSKVPAAASAACASRGRDVSTTDAVIVRGRSASASSSSGMGAGSADEAVRCGRRGLGILVFES